MSLELADRIRWCRAHFDLQDQLSWGHMLGEPWAVKPLSWYPAELAQLNSMFNGLKTELLEFDPYEKQIERRSEAEKPSYIGLGVIYHIFTVSVEVETLEVSIMDESDFDTPEMWEEDEEPTPVFTVQDPLKFFDEYVFGPKYPELIDDILDIDLAPDCPDRWRDLLARIS